LLRMQETQDDIEELIDLCKQTHIGNTIELEIIKKIEREYSADKAIYFYTGDNCLFKMLNKALRTKDIETIVSFRRFIRDLYKQLKKLHRHQQQTITKVFRGQMMSREELTKLCNSVEGYVSMNSFLSTSLDKQVALEFLKLVKYNDQLQPGDINEYSYFKREKEVLFFTGSIFYIQQVRQNEQYWTIQLQLCGEQNNELKDIFYHLKKQIAKETDLILLGRILMDMGEREKAEEYLINLLSKLPKNDHRTISRCLAILGHITNGKGDDYQAIHYHQQSIKIAEKFPDNELLLAENYCGLANGYDDKGNHTQALIYYQKTLKIYKKFYDDNHINLALIYFNIGKVYNNENNSIEALSYYMKAIKIQESKSINLELAKTYEAVGDIFYNKHDYVRSLSYHEKALKINVKTHPSTDVALGISYANVASMNNATGDYPSALTNYLKAQEIFLHSLSPSDPVVNRIENDIKKVKQKLK
ncbi:unnamed protein product, partial [Didymodactylos carnosus]